MVLACVTGFAAAEPRVFPGLDLKPGNLKKGHKGRGHAEHQIKLAEIAKGLSLFRHGWGRWGCSHHGDFES
jgi:hypothetical protein